MADDAANAKSIKEEAKEYVITRAGKVGTSKKGEAIKSLKVGDKVKLTDKQATAYRANHLIN